MRVGMVVPGFSADPGDWCIPALRNLVRELAPDHEVHVFSLRYPHRRDDYVVDGARVHALGGGLARGLARIPLLASAVRSVIETHRREPFDMLHAFWADEPGAIATSAGRLLRIPTVVSVMGGELASLPEIGYGGQLRGQNRRLIRHSIANARQITVGSSFLGGMLEALLPGSRSLRVPLGVDPILFSPAASRPTGRPIKLLKVGSLVPVKGHELLLRAVALVLERNPEIHLEIVGEGPLRPSLERLALDLGISGRAAFRGHIPHDRLPALYRAADLFIQSSLHESQGVAVLEALACGVPVVGTPVGILPELGPPVLAAYDFEPESLAATILKSLELSGSAAGKASLPIGLTVETTAATFARLYRRLVSGDENDAPRLAPSGRQPDR